MILLPQGSQLMAEEFQIDEVGFLGLRLAVNVTDFVLLLLQALVELGDEGGDY